MGTNIQPLLQLAETASLEELEPLFAVLANRINTYRAVHKGSVPSAVFESLLGMAGVSVSVQIVNEVVDESDKRIGWALRKRTTDEVGWIGLYNNTCTVLRMTDTPTTALARDTQETFGTARDEDLEFLGNTLNYERERLEMCLTVMYRRRVSAQEVAGFIGEWKIFSDEQVLAHDTAMVDYNWYQLQYAMDEHREKFWHF